MVMGVPALSPSGSWLVPELYLSPAFLVRPVTAKVALVSLPSENTHGNDIAPARSSVRALRRKTGHLSNAETLHLADAPAMLLRYTRPGDGGAPAGSIRSSSLA
jgi:hypothetical protein